MYRRTIYAGVALCLFGLALATRVGAIAANDNARPVLTGTVTRVIDGDTIAVNLKSGSIRVRLHGIDAPERGQPGGSEATAALKRWILNREVELEPFEQDRYDRLIAIVYLADTNINSRMVREGHAWAYRQYLRKTDGALCGFEASARSAKLGLWSLPREQQVAPWEYRRRKSLHHFTDTSSLTAAQCISRIGKH